MEEEGETRLCSNCKREIAAKTFELHEVHCRRHITLCQICGDPVPVKEQEQHFQEYHALEACDICGEQVQRDKLEEHKDQLCPERKVECKYCELDIKSRDYEQHVDNCGSRTDFCDRCLRRVMLKDMEEHRAFKCGRANSSDEEEVDPTLENLFPDTHGHGHFDGLPLGAQDLLYGTVHYDDEYENEHLEEPVNDFHSNGLPGPDREFEPQDVQGGDSSVLVDQSWLETVAKACGPDFDHVLAQNMYYENMRQVSARDEYHGIENGMLQEGVTANRQREEQYQQQQNDADLARQLQSQFDNRQMEEQRDAELAQQLQQEVPPPPYEAPPPPYQTPPTYPAPSVEEDAELAQRLQEEELKRHQRNEGGGVPGPDNEELYQRESGVHLPDNERYGDRVRDSPSFNPRSSYSTPRDTYPESPTSYSNPYDRHSAFYSTTAYHDDEQPRPKTPPPKKVGSKRRTPYTNSRDPSYADDEEESEEIPCQFCHQLFPFEAIMLHQQHCTADYSTTCSACGRVHARSTSSSSDNYGDQRRVDVEALLKESSDSEEELSGTSATCQYCGHSFPSTCIMPHQALCEKNPDKHLKDVYRSPRANPPRTIPPRPLMGGAGENPLPSKFEAEIPCEFCGRKLKATMIHAHQPVCQQNPSYKVHRSERFIETGESQRLSAEAEAALPGGVERGPCEFCGQLVPLMELVKHQATCQFLDETKSTVPFSTSSAHYAATTHYTATSPTYHTAAGPTHYTATGYYAATSPTHYTATGYYAATSPIYHTATNPTHIATSPTHYTATGRTLASPIPTATSSAHPTVVPAARQNKPRPAGLKPATLTSSATIAQGGLTSRFESPINHASLPRATGLSAVPTATISLGDPAVYSHMDCRVGQAATPLTYSNQGTSSPGAVESRKRLSPSSDFSPANCGSKVPRLSSNDAYGTSAIGQSGSYGYATTGSLSPTGTESVLSHLSSSSSNQHRTPITLAPLTQPYGASITLPSSVQPYGTPFTQPQSAQPYSTPPTQPLSPTAYSASSITKPFVPTGRQQTSGSSHLPKSQHFSSEADFNSILNHPRPALGGISTVGLTTGAPSTPSPTIASDTYPSIPTGPLNSLASGTQGLVQPSSSANRLYSKTDQYSKDGGKTKKDSEKDLSSLLRITHNPAQLSRENAPASVSTSVSDCLPQAAPKPALVDQLSSYTTATPYGGGLVNGNVPSPAALNTGARDHRIPLTGEASHDPGASTVESEMLQGKGSGSASQSHRGSEPAPEGLESRFASLALCQADGKGLSAEKTGRHGVKQSNLKSHSSPKPPPRLPRASGNLKNNSSGQTSMETPKSRPRMSATKSTKSPKPPASIAKPPTSNPAICSSSGQSSMSTAKSGTTPPQNNRKSGTTPLKTSTAPGAKSGITPPRKSGTTSPRTTVGKSTIAPPHNTTAASQKSSNVSPQTSKATRSVQSRTVGSSSNPRGIRQSGKRQTGTQSRWQN